MVAEMQNLLGEAFIVNSYYYRCIFMFSVYLLFSFFLIDYEYFIFMCYKHPLHVSRTLI